MQEEAQAMLQEEFTRYSGDNGVLGLFQELREQSFEYSMPHTGRERDKLLNFETW